MCSSLYKMSVSFIFKLGSIHYVQLIHKFDIIILCMFLGHVIIGITVKL